MNETSLLSEGELPQPGGGHLQNPATHSALNGDEVSAFLLRLGTSPGAHLASLIQQSNGVLTSAIKQEK